MRAWEWKPLPSEAPEFTGERVVPGQVDADLFNEHLSRYAFAKRFAAGARALDLGCGTGYGASVLATAAQSVTGLDLSDEAVEYARAHYVQGNLQFEQGDAAQPPPGPFELITAFEVIEHLENWRGLLHGARDVLGSQGRFLISTPNKPYYQESRGEAGRNPFHVHEFEFKEFREELSAVFPHVSLLIQNHSSGILFAPVSFVEVPEPGQAEIAIADSRTRIEEAHFFVAVCALEPLGKIGTFFWVPTVSNLLRDREHHIDLLQGEVDLKTIWIEKSRAELAARNQEYETLLHLHRALRREMEERNRWATEQQEEIRIQGQRVLELQAEAERNHAHFGAIAIAYEERMAELEQTSRAKTEWGLETERRLTARGAELVHCIELLDAAENTVKERTLWAQSLSAELEQAREQLTALRQSFLVRAGRRLKLIADRP